MTDQEAFDKMVDHLATLQGRSVNSNGYCIYNGSKCAVGALLTDYELHKFGGLEGDVNDLLELMSESGHTTPLSKVYIGLLNDMQSMHDEIDNWDDEGFNAWGQVAEIASLTGLNFNDPRKVKNDG